MNFEKLQQNEIVISISPKSLVRDPDCNTTTTDPIMTSAPDDDVTENKTTEAVEEKSKVKVVTLWWHYWEESDFSTLPLRICCIICFCIYVFINRNCRFSINLFFNSSWHEAVTPFKNFLLNSIVYRYHLFQNISKKHSVFIKFNFSYTTLT